MARRRRDADTSDIARADIEALSTPTPLARVYLDQIADVDHLTDVEDRRQYHPAATLRSPLLASGLPATIGERPNARRPQSSVGQYPAVLHHPNVQHAVVCARRKTRREVILARRYHRRRRGRGGGRRNLWSTIKC